MQLLLGKKKKKKANAMDYISWWKDTRKRTIFKVEMMNTRLLKMFTSFKNNDRNNFFT